MSAAIGTTAMKPILEPLMLAESEEASTGNPETLKDSTPATTARVVCPCLLCDVHFPLDEQEEILRHLMINHRLVISDTKLIANFKSYILYWKQRLKEQLITDFCSVINASSRGKENELTVENYYLLSDVLPEDKELRQFLQKRKLEKILSAQQIERENTSFSRGCLFCKQHFTGNRSFLFDHMSEDHGFNIGQTDNIVFSDELLNKLKDKLDRLLCIYCEKTFKDRATLKEHMRKKQHKTIDPKNTEYDKFYVINYLELGKNWETIQSEDDRGINMEDEDTDTEDDWCQWQEEAGCKAMCLFCEFASSSCDKLKMHMQELHDFDLSEIKLQRNLSFYQQIKLINFIRRQVHLGICIGCTEKFDSKQDLLDHMHKVGHTHCIPQSSVWDQPEYYFPTYENDNLLCQLDDMDDDRDDPSCVKVIAEDCHVPDSILSEDRVRQDILSDT